ncbi:MAG TPA: hypothetical protein VKH35_05660, partial [Thermoanaerobaculia bacterium]|nr:hypothetical protein [Thermoanaerobaculia bacterium]
WETRQAGYVAMHDAAMSRGASTTAEMLSRFVAHPWGPKWIALPVLLLACIGAVVLLRKPRPALVPIALFSIVQFAFAVTVMDPADGPRYSLPHMIGVALLAGAGLALVRRISAVPWVLVSAFAAASMVYTWPLIGVRRVQPSPPAAAAAWADAHLPPDTVIGYDLSLHPHAEHLLSRFRSMPADVALGAFYDRPRVPVVLFGDGLARSAGAKVFAWPASDVYGKLTRNHYRVVTLDPLLPAERFLPLRGVDHLERTAESGEWRWLARDAVLRLPPQHGPSVTLTFQLSPDAPFDTNNVHLTVNGKAAGEVIATHGPSPVKIAVPDGPAEIAIHSDQAFAPASILHNQDPRVLAVELIDLQSQ